MGVFNQTVSMIVVSGKSDYQTLADLKGKKIQMGSSGSGQCLMNMALIAEDGMTPDDFSPEYMSQSDGTQAFTEGKSRRTSSPPVFLPACSPRSLHPTPIFAS
jgi:ABC-type nitrate/sulfonate/bicarbonate transport system substrate-binding protein